MDEVSTRSSSSDIFAEYVKDEEQISSVPEQLQPVIDEPPIAQSEEPCAASKPPDVPVPCKRKRPKNSRHRRVGPQRKKHKALRQQVEVLDVIAEENEDSSIQNVHQEQDDMQEQQVIHEAQDVKKDNSNNVSPSGKRKYRKRKGQVSAPRKNANKEAKKEQLVICDLDSVMDKSDILIDVPDGNDFEEHEFLFNSPNLQADIPIHTSQEILMSDFHSKTEALETLKQNLVGLLEESAWTVDISHDLCRLALLTTASNIAVEKALVWKSSAESSERVEIFIYNKPLPKPNFLWDIQQPEHDNLKLVAEYLVKLTVLLETVHICEGVSSYANYWASACENGLGEVEASFYNGNCHYRSVSCSLVVMENKSCSACGNDYMRFKRKKYRVTNARGKDALRINNRYLPKKLLIAKTERLAAANKNLKKTVAQLRKRIRKLIKKDNALIDENLSKDFMKILKDNLHSMTPVQKLFWNEQVKAIAKQNVPRGVRWSPMMIKIALHLQMLSPTTYNFLQETGILQLPSSRRLYDFTHYAEVKEGVQDPILDRLKEKLDKLKSNEHENFFNLLFDEMNVHSDLVITKSGEVFGFTNLTNVEKSIQDLEDDLANVEGKKELAKKALVYMLQGIGTNIHQVVGIYSTTDLSAQQIFTRTWDIIYNLECRDIAVLCLVCDGASSNKKFYRMHERWDKSKDFVYATKNVASGDDRPIFFVIDPPHLMKSLRNCLSNSYAHTHTRKMWKNGENLSWEAIEKLHSATLTDKFKKHKLTFGHVKLTAFSRMNVRLATQTMSASVAKSLSDYKYDESFNSTVTDALIQFLQIVNNFFDCLNGSHDPEGRRNKSNPFLLPYTSIEDERFKILKEEVLGFFEEWKADVKNREGNFSEEDRERMMISNLSFESLQVTIYGFCAAVKFLLRNNFSSVDAKDFNQDKLEQYFGIVRMSGGASNNPTLYRLANTVQALTAQQEIAIPPKKGNTRANSVTLQVNQEPLPCRKQAKKK